MRSKYKHQPYSVLTLVEGTLIARISLIDSFLQLEAQGLQYCAFGVVFIIDLCCIP